MKYFPLVFAVAMMAAPLGALGQSPSSPSAQLFAEPSADGGGGQVVPAGYGDKSFSRLAFAGAGSTLGTGGAIAINGPGHLDLRVLGNYTSFTYNFTQSQFKIGVNLGMENVGAMADYYPWKRLRVSAGYLFFNGDRVRADLEAGPDATFTINNTTYLSDNADPVHGVGRLVLAGRGFMVTGGWGHIVSHSHKHFTFPIEAGVALIDTPFVTFNLGGKACLSEGVDCQNIATYPGFQSNLQVQLSKWNSQVAPFHIYPLITGGVAYTFRFRK